MCENILDFLQNIQDSTTIPNKSPIFEKPFLVLEQLGFIHQGYTNTNAVSNYNLFEKNDGRLTHQLSICYDFEKDTAFVESICFLKRDMNVKSIVMYGQNRMITVKEIIPEGAYNYCEFNYYYTYKDDQLITIRFRHNPYPKSLPEVYLNEIIMTNDGVSYIDFIYFGLDAQTTLHNIDNTHHDLDMMDMQGLEFCENTFKSIIDLNTNQQTIESLITQFPIKITKQQACVIMMSKI
jgi:hypothetical protein